MISSLRSGEEITHNFAAQPSRASDRNHSIFDALALTLINGASFSSTGHIASLLDYHNIGTFIGQETGGGYLCTDDSSSLVLEHTGLVLYSSRRIFRTAVEGMTLGRGISPDYETTPTVVDYINGVDLEMDKALELMSEG